MRNLPKCFGNVDVCGTARCSGCTGTIKDACLDKVSKKPKAKTNSKTKNKPSKFTEVTFDWNH